MRVALALLPLLAAAQALHRGKAYVREKVCQEYKILGKENFRTMTIVANSRKYSNGTFEEISSLVREIVSLAETCCADGADPSCYDNGSTALSEKSCSAGSPFPAHPGAAECCARQGLERKLCLAALRHPAPPGLPRYLQPSDRELCLSFRADPREFADRFLYEYSSSYSQAPLPVLLASTTSFLSMVSTCCISPAPAACFLKEVRPAGAPVLAAPLLTALIPIPILFLRQKLERKTLSLLTLTSNRICSRFSAYGKDKVSFRYGGKWPLHPGTGAGLLSPAADPVGRQHSGTQALILVHRSRASPALPIPSLPPPGSELFPGKLLDVPSSQPHAPCAPQLPGLAGPEGSHCSLRGPPAPGRGRCRGVLPVLRLPGRGLHAEEGPAPSLQLLEHTAKVCAALAARDARFAGCCKGKNLMENHFCILAMLPAPAPELPEPPEPTNKELCAKDGALHATRFLFELARRHPNLPDAVLAKLYDSSGKLRGECCSSKDPSACWDSKRRRIEAELFPFLQKANQLCGQHNQLPFLDFKKRLRDSLAQAEPRPGPEQLEQLLEQRASFASTCCLPAAPPLLCASKVSSELGELCQKGSCLLG
ncbi:vitamin D-binding protein isoform X2 [Onychostruthus taczanowskii]|uniref:vitamin D-binding protein isoform X2 n=1 Tax=Onychostruthus taczanowskii TaxID=356909 RepID=UPI001B8078E7|nr:vitamin D-binding protein isoform X2 [Onychostruthus taczanowskii]